MAWDILLDPATLDLPVGGGRAVVRRVGDDDLFSQHLITRLRTFRGEVLMFPEDGIPYVSMRGNRALPMSFVEDVFASQAAQVPDVQSVRRCVAEFDIDTRTVTVTLDIVRDDGSLEDRVYAVSADRDVNAAGQWVPQLVSANLR